MITSTAQRSKPKAALSAQRGYLGRGASEFALQIMRRNCRTVLGLRLDLIHLRLVFGFKLLQAGRMLGFPLKFHVKRSLRLAWFDLKRTVSAEKAIGQSDVSGKSSDTNFLSRTMPDMRSIQTEISTVHQIKTLLWRSFLIQAGSDASSTSASQSPSLHALRSERHSYNARLALAMRYLPDGSASSSLARTTTMASRAMNSTFARTTTLATMATLARTTNLVAQQLVSTEIRVKRLAAARTRQATSEFAHQCDSSPPFASQNPTTSTFASNADSEALFQDQPPPTLARDVPLQLTRPLQIFSRMTDHPLPQAGFKLGGRQGDQIQRFESLQDFPSHRLPTAKSKSKSEMSFVYSQMNRYPFRRRSANSTGFRQTVQSHLDAEGAPSMALRPARATGSSGSSIFWARTVSSGLPLNLLHTKLKADRNRQSGSFNTDRSEPGSSRERGGAHHSPEESWPDRTAQLASKLLAAEPRQLQALSARVYELIVDRVRREKETLGR